MVDSCKRLQGYPVDFIAIPCNSAHFWLRDLRKKIKTPIVSIIDETVEVIASSLEGENVSVLGGFVTYEKQLYKAALESKGLNYLKISESDQANCVELIEKIKLKGNNTYLHDEFVSFVKALKEKYNLDGIVLACTEFSIFRNIKFDCPVYDSSDILARKVSSIARGEDCIRLDVGQIKDFWKSRSENLKNKNLGAFQSTMLTPSESRAQSKWQDERDKLLGQIKPFFKKEDTILELGCGIGRWSRVLSKHVKHVDACDYLEDFIIEAKKITLEHEIENISFSTCAAESIESRKSYDHVVSVALFHYLSDSQLKSTIDKMKELVKVNGKIILRESFGTTKRFELHQHYSEALDSEYSAIYRTSDEIKHLFGMGFKKVAEETTLTHSKSKEETCQKLLILEKTGE
jgi:aspartate/glutamate racemase/2-polyprenyl-3-methyl-5-hydroxy-6-metoxy-1,4-benzoquinol methylase